MRKHFAWDYEESVTNYYHIYSCSGEAEEVIEDSIILNLPKTKLNDDFVQLIVENLELLVLNKIWDL